MADKLGTYSLQRKEEKVRAYKRKVACVLKARKHGLSFAKAAKLCDIGTRQEAYDIYRANRDVDN